MEKSLWLPNDIINRVKLHNMSCTIGMVQKLLILKKMDIEGNFEHPGDLCVIIIM